MPSRLALRKAAAAARRINPPQRKPWVDPTPRTANVTEAFDFLDEQRRNHVHCSCWYDGYSCCHYNCF